MVNRQVVGAGYGFRDWLIQRLTAVMMLVYVVTLLVFLWVMPSSYPAWQDFFTKTWVRLLTQITWLALVLHAWVGMRDLWMDYIKNTGIRLMMHTLTAVWLIGTLIYSIKVIWGIV
jgi:succinate dehydrogenase / fumarate reductase membrane anchor subunit